MANIKFIGAGPKKGEVHIKESNQKTGCGAIISDNPQDWKITSEAVTCQKKGCSTK